MIKLDALLVRNFSRLFLLAKYDNPQPIPNFHNEMWDLCCADHKYVAIAAPRGHAKSTAISLAYLMCAVLFRIRSFALLISSTERKAAKFLGDIRSELVRNEDLIREFDIKRLEKDSETEIWIEFTDGHRACIMAKGAGPDSKVRGEKWNNKRPDIVICDDIEDDESVMNPDRREKFRDWLLKALFPVGSDDCIYRVVGTILHFDSFLARALADPEWGTLCFKAHKSFDNFSELLWPEKWPEARLRKERGVYISQGNAEGYSQEYLNIPLVEGQTFFRKTDFLPIKDHEERLTHYAGIDFAISQKERADETAIKVAGVAPDGTLKYVHSVSGHWDAKQICDEMFYVQSRFDIDLFFAEADKIQKAIGPFLYDMMGKADDNGDIRPFINIETLTPSKDKRTRASSLQGRMRAGNVQWDTEADWFPVVQEEMCRFPRAPHDDHVDSAGIICLGLKQLVEAPTDQEVEEEEYFMEFGEDETGKSVICGY